MRGLYHSNHPITFLILSFFIFSCSQLGLQSKKETGEPSQAPECERNYTREGIWPFNRVYKTWVKYDPLDYKRGFDAALMAVKSSGCRAIFADRDSGTISAEVISASEDQETYPVEIKLVREKNALTVHLSSSKASGDSGKERFCSFYKEFEKSMRRPQPPQVPKQAPAQAKKPLEKPVEQEKEPPPPPPSSPAASVGGAPETAKPPSQPAPPSNALPKAYVVWAKVNLREGPGMNYKVVDQVKKGTPLIILEKKEGWLYVRLESGKEGWLSKSATSEEVKNQTASGPPPSRPSSSSPPSSSVPSPAAQSTKPASPM